MMNRAAEIFQKIMREGEESIDAFILDFQYENLFLALCQLI